MAGGLSILMPVFNERSTVEAAIDDALTRRAPGREPRARHRRRRLDRRDAGAPRLARRGRTNVKVVFHERNLGKGAAVRTALQHATEEFAAILDADLEYRAADLADVLEPLVSGEAHVVFGTRAWTSQSSFSFWYVMGNKAVTMATNVLYNCWISDVMTCHKAMRTELFRSLPLRERGFAIEPEIAARLLRAGERIHEVPISYTARAREAGKKLTTIDGLRVLRTLVRCRISLSRTAYTVRRGELSPSRRSAQHPSRTGPRRPAERGDRRDVGSRATLVPELDVRPRISHDSRDSPKAASTASASSLTDVSRPLPTLSTAPAVAGSSSTRSHASTTSSTKTKSRVCSPSPWIVIGSPRRTFPMKIASTPWYGLPMLCRGP